MRKTNHFYTELSIEEAEKLEKISNEISGVVDYGLGIMQDYLNAVSGGNENIPGLLLTRQIMELLDAISVMIKSGVVDPCKILLRSILESYFQLEYLFEADCVRRGLAFIVQFQISGHDLLLKYTTTTIDTTQQLEEAKKGFENFLTLPLYSEVVTEYERMKQAKIKHPKWYQYFDGPSSLYKLSEYLGRKDLYNLLYGAWSGDTYGQNALNQNLETLLDRSVIIKNIRKLNDLELIQTFTKVFARMTLTLLGEKRVPEKKHEIAEWSLSLRLTEK